MNYLYKFYFGIVFLLPISVLAQGNFWGANSAGIFKTNALGGNIEMPYKFKVVNQGYFISGINYQLLETSNGLFYGTAPYGGNYSKGLIYSYNLDSNRYTVIHHFNDTNGAGVSCNPIQASNGNLYGVTFTGGSDKSGVLFEYNLATHTYTTLWNFTSNTGIYPNATALLEISPGKLLGHTIRGGTNGVGVIFSFDISTSTYIVLYQYSTLITYSPVGSFLKINQDTFIGCTTQGGANSAGLIYMFDLRNNTLTKLHDFSTSTGTMPTGELTLSGEVLYGICSSGGKNNNGAIFEWNLKSKSYRKVVDFPNSGSPPEGGLCEISQGRYIGLVNKSHAYFFETMAETITPNTYDVFMGTPVYSKSKKAILSILGEKTYGAGSVNATIAVIDTKNNVAIPKVEMSTMNARLACSQLVIDKTGIIYGLTFYGGWHDLGVFFSYDPSRNLFKNLWDYSDSIIPIKTTIENPAKSRKTGCIYFTNNKNSDLLEYNLKTGQKRNYSLALTGAQPNCLFEIKDGSFFLQTSDGILYEIDVVNKKVIWTHKLKDNPVIQGSSIFAYYMGELVEHTNGLLYGINSYGGKYGNGCIYSYHPKTHFSRLVYSFDGTPGKQPISGLRIDSLGNLYGSMNYLFGFVFNIPKNTINYLPNFSAQGQFALGSNGKFLFAAVQEKVRVYDALKDTVISSVNFPAGSQCTGRLTEICYTPACGPIRGKNTICSFGKVTEYEVDSIVPNILYSWRLPKGAYFTSGDSTSRKVKIAFTEQFTSSYIYVVPYNECPGNSSRFWIYAPTSKVVWKNIKFKDTFLIGKNVTLKTSNINGYCHKDLEFSSDSGKTFIPIISDLQASDSVFTWKIPNAESVNCFFRVSGQNPGDYWLSPRFCIASPIPYTTIDFLGEFTKFSANSSNPANAVQPGYPLRFKLQIQNKLPNYFASLKGTLTSSDSHLVITKPYSTFNNNSPGIKSWSVEAFEIYIKPNCPENHVLVFDLAIAEDTGNTEGWTSRSKIRFPVNVMDFSSIDIYDGNSLDSKGDKDGIVEAGEIIEFTPKLRNKSNWKFDKPIGWLTTTNSYVQIWDSVIVKSGSYFNTSRYNGTFAAHGPLWPNGKNVIPERNFAFTYLADTTFSLYFNMYLDCYLTDFTTENPSGAGNVEPKIRYGVTIPMNSGYAEPMLVQITNPADSAKIPIGSLVSMTAFATSAKSLESVALFIQDSMVFFQKAAQVQYNWNTKNLLPGSYTIKVVSKDIEANSASDVIHVNLITTGNIQRISENSISVRPNPNSGLFHIVIPVLKKPINAILLNQLGQILDSFPLTSSENTLDYSKLKTGTYWLKITTGHTVETIKIIILN